MYIEKIPNRKSPPAILIRESYRENGKVKKRTIANISQLPENLISLISEAVRGQKFSKDEVYEIIKSLQHGNVEAVKLAMEKLKISSLLSSKSGPEKKIIEALICSRILHPESKLATNQWWDNTTIRSEFDLPETTADDIYKAMDWLLQQKPYIEKKLAGRHLEENDEVFYDLSSSYFEGKHCPIAQRGHNRDKKKGKLQVNYGLLTNNKGIPISIDIFKGNVSDSKTVTQQVKKVQGKYKIKRATFVGDRGMIGQKQIDEIKKENDFYWITALKSQTIKKLIKNKSLQVGLFDEQDLFEVIHPEYPGERLVACKNTLLADYREKTRQELMEATEKELKIIQERVKNKTYQGKDEIGLKIGEIINKYKVKKYFKLEIRENKFEYGRDIERIQEDRNMDGLYIIRTNLKTAEMETNDVVRKYKDLSKVEKAFRSIKTEDLHVRPIYHYNENRVKAHIFLCMLAYYVEWHMKEVLSPFLFTDEFLEETKKTKNPIHPAQRSEAAKRKESSLLTTVNGEVIPVKKWRMVLEDLSTIQKNECRYIGTEKNTPSFFLITRNSSYQEKIFEFLNNISL